MAKKLVGRSSPRITVRLPKPLRRELVRLAREQRMGPSEVLRLAVVEHLRRQEVGG